MKIRKLVNKREASFKFLEKRSAEERIRLETKLRELRNERGEVK